MSVMTQGYLIEAIGYLLAQIEERWPERVYRDPPEARRVLDGTYVKVRDDLTLWVGDHYVWDDWGGTGVLQRIADSLSAALGELEAA